MSAINSLTEILQDVPTADTTDGRVVDVEEWWKDIGFDMSGDHLDKAIEIWTQSYKHILNHNLDATIKIEEFAEGWEELTGDALPKQVRKNQSGKDKKYTLEDITDRMSKDTRELFDFICDKFGY